MALYPLWTLGQQDQDPLASLCPLIDVRAGIRNSAITVLPSCY